MNIERLFLKTATKLEELTKQDLSLLKNVGITNPFFKTEQGFNTIVVYGYKEGRKRFVAKFKNPNDPKFDEEMAKKLMKKFCVSEFFGDFDVSDKNLKYLKMGNELSISSWEKEKWIGYDYSIRILAAVSLLSKCNLDMRSETGKTAEKIILQVGIASGKTFGKLYNNGLVYDEFRPDNLAGEDEACFFDIHGRGTKKAFWLTKEIKVYLESAGSFFRFVKATAFSQLKDEKSRNLFGAIIKRAFLEGLKLSGTDKTLIKKVSENIGAWI